MEALSEFVDTPDIVVSNSAHKNSPQALAAKKKPSSEASNVKKWLEQLASETPLVSKGLKELLFQQTALQNEVSEGTMSLEMYYNKLAKITEKFLVVEKQFSKLVDFCNKLRCTLPKDDRAEEPEKDTLRREKDKFDSLRGGLNEMLSRMNNYRMAQLQTRKMLLTRPERDTASTQH